jgi:phenylalanyl-tRNA synthetase alpha chain
VSDAQPTDESVSEAVDAALAAIDAAADTAGLKAARIAHLGDASALARLNATIRDLPPAEKPAAGRLLGQARSRVAAAVAAREAALLEVERAALLEAERVDVTAAPVRERPGARHPLTLVREAVEDAFVAMGWEIAEGPELESEWYNFDALNFDADHPARAMQDTFFVEPTDAHLVLRTHTSPVQLRALLGDELPVYRIAPGRVFRTDEFDATHLPVFTQTEGIAVD